jgi:hypothetical protein
VLVEARYAVRNNQRSFLKVTLPPGSRIWSASVAGRPTRPGVAEGTAVLVPLEKGRAGVEAPTFLVTVLYFQAVAAWPNQGRARLELPAVDLPISRTGLSIHHSPRFQATPQPGAFRVDVDPGPSAEAFRRPPPVASPAAARPVATLEEGATSGLQLLIDRFRNEPGGRTVVGALPVSVPFPPLGPSVFLASELTAEGRTSAVELVVKRTK